MQNMGCKHEIVRKAVPTSEEQGPYPSRAGRAVGGFAAISFKLGSGHGTPSGDHVMKKIFAGAMIVSALAILTGCQNKFLSETIQRLSLSPSKTAATAQALHAGTIKAATYF